MAMQVWPPVLLPLHSAPGPHCCPFSHDCPIAGGATHVPQRISPPSGSSFAAVQSPPWHCAVVTHVAPAPSDPVSKVQGPCSWSSTEHPPDLTAATHASRDVALSETPGNVSAAAQSVSKRPWMRVTSLAGSGPMVSQAPLKIVLK
jgi:hypothetical protein